MPRNTKTIIWKTGTEKIKVASFRIRCILPALTLQGYGYTSVLVSGNESVLSFEGVLAIVFVKTFSDHDFNLAREAFSRGVPVYLDLCDNIFIPHYRHSKAFLRFIDMAGLAKAIVTTGTELARILESHLKTSTKLVVIPDQVEAQHDLHALTSYVDRMKKPNSTIHLGNIISRQRQRLRNFLVSVRDNLIWVLLRFRNGVRESIKSGAIRVEFFGNKETPSSEFLRSNAKTVIWFGNAGGGFSRFGMPSLAEICEQLMRVNVKIPIKLLVVSNDFHAYQNMIAGFPLLSAYKKWSYRHIFDDISGADVCVIPNSKDDFSLCKSPNRTLLALSLGVPVVVTDIPSIDDVRSCVILDDWENGLITYLTDPDRVAHDIAKAKLILDEKYSSNTVASLWHELFQTGQTH